MKDLTMNDIMRMGPAAVAKKNSEGLESLTETEKKVFFKYESIFKMHTNDD